MKRIATLTVLAALATASMLMAQSEAPTGQKTLAATMNVYVFPSSGQAADQQSKEEAECYNWAVSNTGTDPFELAKKAQDDAQQAQQAQAEAAQVGQGAGASGAVKGAAAGALIGGIANDDAGKGAAYGAAAGVISGRRRGRAAQEQASAQASDQSAKNQAWTAEQLDNFKKAFSVCLEAKDYMVKF
jgi:hypothetical protein